MPPPNAYQCSPFGSNMDRQAFLKRLAPTPKGHGTSSLDSDERKRYMRSLAQGTLVDTGKADPESASSGQTVATNVCFDLKKLREFKAVTLQCGWKGDGGDAPARKRPNYDNSKRRLLANPKHRVK